MDIEHSPGFEIPDGEILYRYCRPESFPEDQPEIPLGVFNDKEMSCDWAYYQKNPSSSFHITEGRSLIIAITITDAIRNPTNPKRTGQVVPDWHQNIVYDPILKVDAYGHEPNISHSLIDGLKKWAVKEALRDSSEIINR